MMRHLNDHTVVLSPDQPKEGECNRPTKRLNRLEAEIREAISSAIKNEVEKRAWLLAQLKRSRQYEASLSQRGYRQVEGLPSWQPGPADTKIMIRQQAT